ncbi:glycoside hydrolase domain-containing protein, partial [Streptacidiphilus jiangxiensis]
MAARTTRTKTTVLATTLAAAAIAAATSLPAHADTPAQHPATTKTATKQVDYQGYRFTVPRSWTVVDLARHPNTCVRFDRHTLYLGHPGANQACPSHSIGRTEAVLVQPATNPAGAQGTRTNTVAHEIDTTAARVTVTATYNTDRALVQHILTGAHLPTTAPRTGGTVRSHLAQAATAALPSGATNYTGKGFDTCSAPSSSTMSTWKANSPYSSVGVYIGGSNMGCSQPNLTASWVQAQYNAGWRFQPVYVGEQAAAISSPTSEGTAAADDAVTQATNLGFGTGSTLYYDMEQYDTSSYGANVLAFESAWTKELHAKGYHSGLYSSSSSGITDLANNYSSQYTMPDVIFDALWNGSADTNDSVVPSNEWSNHQRAHQYGGNTNETYGGVTINVDDDYLDVQMSTTNVQPMSNLVSVGNGNILAVDQSGNLWRYSAPNY